MVTSEELEILKEHYSSFQNPVFYCSNQLEILWSNPAAGKIEQKYTKDISVIWEEFFFSLQQSDPTTTLSFHFICGDTCAWLRYIPVGNGGFLEWLLEETDSNSLSRFYEFSMQSSDLFSVETRIYLTNIFNVLPFLYKEMEQQEQYESLDYLKQISQNAYHLLKMVNNSLAYRKLSPNSLRLTAVDITKELEQLFILVQANLLRSNKTFEYHLPDSPILMQTDVEKLHIALLNLISNGYLYGGSDNLVSVSVCIQKEDLIIRVTDHGEGISTEQFERVFTPYYSYNPNTGTHSGIGLGLPYTKKLAECLGGSCLLTSQPHQGTQVVLRLPIKNSVKDTVQFQSNRFEYSTGRFSPVSIYLSDICEIPIF